ncbi:hypothetical protein EZJ49_13985 [Bdellovibrio bacteriovorus]|uniref:LexA family protein n=1 Tax=Bdellovibrio bacteriovorus TaxID=959 RepID=UPI0021D01590|nr:S24 family peptidase [Bdellovibrio bacteriovorus]UXR64172.1 hypothetical protein EZJ49_13985 [Bdellovibrio bacteriovorus]
MMNKGSFSFVAMLVINPVVILFYQNCSMAPISHAKNTNVITTWTILFTITSGEYLRGIRWPIEAIKHDEFVDVPPSMVRNPSKSFALKVQGDSMIEDGIFDEDIILIQKQDSANNGDIIVATVDNEATVKRFYLRPRPETGVADKMVELRPSNSTMKSMWYSPDEVSIRGIVVGLLRKF